MFCPVITQSRHEDYFHEIPFKQLGNLRMLIGLPPSRVTYKCGNNLMIVTHDGRLLIANNEIPQGSFLDIGVIRVKKVVNRAPFCVKDVNGKFHFIDMFKIVQDLPVDNKIFACSMIDIYECERRYPYLTEEIWNSVISQGIQPSLQDLKIMELNIKLCKSLNVSNK
jgi:hypothetical protein